MSCSARLFINRKAFSGVGMIVLKDAAPAASETIGEVCAIYDLKHEIIGYNLISPYFEKLNDGYQPWNDETLAFVNEKLIKAGFAAIEIDPTPRLVVGYVKSCETHPDSDHLHVCQVDVGQECVQIVCGAANVAANQKVVAALPGAVLPDGRLIEASALRGVDSAGMLCSEWELRLIDEPKRGILILDDQAEIGSPFFGR